MGTVENDTAAHYWRQDREEKETQAQEWRAQEIANAWTDELQRTGEIKYFDWDVMDFACEILEVPIVDNLSYFIENEVFDYLYNEALKAVQTGELNHD